VVIANFKATGTPTPQDPPVVGPVDPSVNPNPDENKNWTVTFAADPAKGTIAAENTFYVLKDSGKTLADLASKAPEVTAKTGFKATGWNPVLDANTPINGNLTVNATFERTGTNPPTPPTPTPNPSLGDKIDDTNKKPVYPIDQDQGTGVIVKETDNKDVIGRDEDGKNIPAVINPNTGEIIVNPGNNVDGPIVVTVVDTKTGEQKDIVIDVIGHSYGRNDNRDYDHNNWWYTPFIPSYSSSSSNTSVNTNVTKKVSRLEVRLVIGSKELRKSIDGIEEITMMDIAPFIEGDRTMLPIRFVAEALGFNVQWDNENRTVILIDKENVVKIPVDTNQ
ncbi:copper amine oxidase N-terminal domain-containing protein, partial [Peptoniphilus hominis (ex Hitch et al. 2025)]